MVDWIFIKLQALFGLTVEWRWVAELFLIVLAVVLVNLLLRFGLLMIRRLARRSKTQWDDSMLDAVSGPLRLAVWVIGITLAADLAVHQLVASGQEVAPVFKSVQPLREAGLVACMGWFLLRLVGNVIDRLQHRYIETSGAGGVDEPTGDAISRLLRAAVLITMALVMLQTLGFSIAGVLAFGGVGGIAIGFAAKDILSNFFGGLFIFLDKPFYVGDWVRSPDQDIEGTVEAIGWRRTVIRRFNKRPLYVPNAVFNTISLENPSRMSNRQIHVTMGLRYSDADQLTQIVDDVRAMLRAHDEIDQQQTMIVNFDEFGPSSLNFFIYTFTKTTNWVRFHEIKHEVLLNAYRIVREHGAEIALPTQTLHLEDNKRPAEREAEAQS